MELYKLILFLPRYAPLSRATVLFLLALDREGVGRAEPVERSLYSLQDAHYIRCRTLRCRAFVILTVVGLCLDFFLSIIFFVA